MPRVSLLNHRHSQDSQGGFDSVNRGKTKQSRGKGRRVDSLCQLKHAYIVAQQHASERLHRQIAGACDRRAEKREKNVMREGDLLPKQTK
jgi:hypothetical protein